MKTIELDESEMEVLQEVLSNYISELRMEIANTDSKDFRDGLKYKEATVKDILQRLR